MKAGKKWPLAEVALLKSYLNERPSIFASLSTPGVFSSASGEQPWRGYTAPVWNRRETIPDQRFDFNHAAVFRSPLACLEIQFDGFITITNRQPHAATACSQQQAIHSSTGGKIQGHMHGVNLPSFATVIIVEQKFNNYKMALDMGLKDHTGRWILELCRFAGGNPVACPTTLRVPRQAMRSERRSVPGWLARAGT